MVVHVITEIRACSPTLTYIISVNMMMIFHGFVCHRVASATQHKHRRMMHMMCFLMFMCLLCIVYGRVYVFVRVHVQALESVEVQVLIS